MSQSFSIVFKTTADAMGTMLASGAANSVPSGHSSPFLSFVNSVTCYANSLDLQAHATRSRTITTRQRGADGCRDEAPSPAGTFVRMTEGLLAILWVEVGDSEEGQAWHRCICSYVGQRTERPTIIWPTPARFLTRPPQDPQRDRDHTRTMTTTRPALMPNSAVRCRGPVVICVGQTRRAH